MSAVDELVELRRVLAETQEKAKQDRASAARYRAIAAEALRASGERAVLIALATGEDAESIAVIIAAPCADELALAPLVERAVAALCREIGIGEEEVVLSAPVELGSEARQTWCVAPRHATPCPEPCSACADECGSTYRFVGSEAAAQKALEARGGGQ